MLRLAYARHAASATVRSESPANSLRCWSSPPSSASACVCVCDYTICTDSPGGAHWLCDPEHISQGRMSAILTPITVTNYRAAGESHPCLTSLDWPMSLCFFIFCLILFFPKKELTSYLRHITIVTTRYTPVCVRLR